tara:strand:+ start:197 stop:310 length:114 start_codon:yes stop_codon:yes gene_type:complete
MLAVTALHHAHRLSLHFCGRDLACWLAAVDRCIVVVG